jgi:hypothetical protein
MEQAGDVWSFVRRREGPVALIEYPLLKSSREARKSDR